MRFCLWLRKRLCLLCVRRLRAVAYSVSIHVPCYREFVQLFIEMSAFVSRMHEHLDVAAWGAKFDPSDGKLVRVSLTVIHDAVVIRLRNNIALPQPG